MVYSSQCHGSFDWGRVCLKAALASVCHDVLLESRDVVSVRRSQLALQHSKLFADRLQQLLDVISLGLLYCQCRRFRAVARLSEGTVPRQWEHHDAMAGILVVPGLRVPSHSRTRLWDPKKAQGLLEASWGDENSMASRPCLIRRFWRKRLRPQIPWIPTRPSERALNRSVYSFQVTSRGQPCGSIKAFNSAWALISEAAYSLFIAMLLLFCQGRLRFDMVGSGLGSRGLGKGLLLFWRGPG